MHKYITQPNLLFDAIIYRLSKIAKDLIFKISCRFLGKWELFSRSAEICTVQRVVVDGTYGEIIFSATDTAILPLYVRDGFWAQDFNDTIKSFFDSSGGTYLDIGANVGLTTIPIAQNPKVQCIAIEPEPRTFANLASNITRNCSHGNVKLLRTAIFHRRATLNFEISSFNSGDHRIRMTDAPGLEGESSRETINVEAIPLDNLMSDQDISEPLVVKIDTQGAEPFVFAGGSRILSRASLVICEWSPYLIYRMGGSPNILVDFFSSHFKKISIIRLDGSRFENASPKEVASELLEHAERAKNNPYDYYDIVLRKY